MISKSEGSLQGQHSRFITFDVTLPGTQGPHPVVLFAHGFKGFKDWGPYGLVASTFASEGFAFVKLNFALNGTTPEEPMEFADLDAFSKNNFSFEVDDLGQILQLTLQNQANWQIDPDRIFLVGHSRGGGICIIVAAENPNVRAVATWASISDFGRFLSVADMSIWQKAGVIYVENSRTGQQMPLQYQLFENYMNNQQRLDILGAMARLTKPCLVVHGTADDTVPFIQATELAAASSHATLFAVERAGHTFGAVHPFVGDELPEDFKVVVRETARFFKSVE